MVARRTPPGLLARHGGTLMAVAIVGTLLGALVFGSRGLLHLVALRGEEHRVVERITRLLEENDRLRTLLGAIRRDDPTLERLAREDLGLVRPGEVIYRVPARTTDPPR